MLQFFASRRTFNAAQGKFTKNVAALTRYVAVDTNAAGVGAGHIKPLPDWLNQVTGQAGSDGIVLYVHGFNTDQTDMLSRMQLIQAGMAQHGFDGVVIGFDWPSSGSALAYPTDKNTAKAVAPHLVPEVLQPILTHASAPKLHLLAHSMGCYLSLRGFSQYGGTWGVREALFVAADVDRQWMETGAWGSLVMVQRSNRLTNYFSNFDDVLSASQTIVSGGRPRAGRSGMPTPSPAAHADVFSGARYQTAVPNKSLTVSHDWYFSDPRFLKDAAKVVQGVSKTALLGDTRAPGAGGHPDQALIP